MVDSDKEKKARQLKIVEIINQVPVRTQEHLLSLLKADEFKVTQATISRDIKELALTKVVDRDGRSKYIRLLRDNDDEHLTWAKKHVKILRETVIDFHPVNNILVIRCTSGGASAACRAIDCLKKDEMLGSIAGDDTVLLIFRSDGETLEFIKSIHALLGF
ncbi:arginine repressor [Clostridia bacterium]|nr:arginine repressor [Clostridia bacterium]